MIRMDITPCVRAATGALPWSMCDVSVASVIVGRCQSRWLRPRPFARQKPTRPRATAYLSAAAA
jgi:hypothetical protein